jgi:hypothetical protein
LQPTFLAPRHVPLGNSSPLTKQNCKMKRPAFAAVFFLLLMVGVSLVHAQPAFEQRSLEEALNLDGTLKQGLRGSFSTKGYTMRTGKNGEPIFLPQTQPNTRQVVLGIRSLACLHPALQDSSMPLLLMDREMCMWVVFLMQWGV